MIVVDGARHRSWPIRVYAMPIAGFGIFEDRADNDDPGPVVRPVYVTEGTRLTWEDQDDDEVLAIVSPTEDLAVRMREEVAALERAAAWRLSHALTLLLRG